MYDSTVVAHVPTGPRSTGWRSAVTPTLRRCCRWSGRCR